MSLGKRFGKMDFILKSFVFVLILVTSPLWISFALVLLISFLKMIGYVIEVVLRTIIGVFSVFALPFSRNKDK